MYWELRVYATESLYPAARAMDHLISHVRIVRARPVAKGTRTSQRMHSYHTVVVPLPPPPSSPQGLQARSVIRRRGEPLNSRARDGSSQSHTCTLRNNNIVLAPRPSPYRHQRGFSDALWLRGCSPRRHRSAPPRRRPTRHPYAWAVRARARRCPPRALAPSRAP
jgi:hypothetical protein